MANYYYSMQPVLAWCLNHYFYDKNHYVYVGAPFYPYALNNPLSSNPYDLYGIWYKIFKGSVNNDKGDFNNHALQGYRNKLKQGVDIYFAQQPSMKRRLRQVCNRASTDFFFPIVYRVDLDTATSHKEKSGSGKQVDSNEWLFFTLQESEFDVLFADFVHESKLDPRFSSLFEGNLTRNEVLAIFEANFHVPQ